MLAKSFLKYALKKKENQTFRGCHLLFVFAFKPLTKREQPRNVVFLLFSTRIFKNFDIHSIICVAQLLLIFAQKGTRTHHVLGRLYSPFPFPPKACHAGNVLLQMDAKYLLVCVLGARHCPAACLVGAWREREYTKGLARLHSPISSPSNTRHVRYRRVSDNL